MSSTILSKGDRVWVLTDQPSSANLNYGETVHVISHPESDFGSAYNTVYVTGPDGTEADIGPRGWAVSRSDLSFLSHAPTEHKVGDYAFFTRFPDRVGRLVRTAPCVTQGDGTLVDHYFDGSLESTGSLHEDEVTWLVPDPNAPVEPEAPEVWEEGSTYRKAWGQTFTVLFVDGDGDAYGYDEDGDKSMPHASERAEWSND